MSNTVKSVSDAKKHIDQILRDRETELTDLADQIGADDAAIATASARMDEATAASDLKTYREAKAALTAAQDAKEMHERRRVFLEEKPLIKKAEYEKTVAAIMADIAALEDKTKQTLAELSDRMFDVGAELSGAIEEANETLHILQHDVFRDADRSKNSKGEIIEMKSETRSINNFDTVLWAQCAARHFMYQNYTGNKRK